MVSSNEDGKPMWLENLEEWVLEENRVVTARILARSIKCHVNVAKERLYHFAQCHKDDQDLEVILLIAGENASKTEGAQDGAVRRRLVQLVRQSEAENATLFTCVTSKHVYAVAKKKVLSDNNNDIALLDADLAAIRDDPHANSFSAIHNKKAVPRSNDSIMANAEKEIKKEVKDVVGKEKMVEVVKEKSSLGESKNTSTKEEGKKSSTVPSKPEPAKTSKKAASSAIAGMFARAAAKKKDDDDVDESETTDSRKRSASKAHLSPEESHEKENRINEERERHSEATKVKRSNAKTLPKRKRIQMMSDSESENDDVKEEAPSDDEEERIDLSPAPPQAALVESDDEKVEPPAPIEKVEPRHVNGQPSGRHKVRKLVVKTSVDAKGFTVTKKEYETCSESDGDDEVGVLKAKNAAPEPVIRVPEKQTKTVAAKKKITSPHKAKQQSIMSFFQKK